MRGGTCRLHLHEKWNLPQTLRLTAAGASGSFFCNYSAAPWKTDEIRITRHPDKKTEEKVVMQDKALASLAILLYNIAIICDDFYKYAPQAA